MNNPTIKAFFDQSTNTVSYIVSDPATKQSVVIDSVLDFDVKSGRTQTSSADELVMYVRDHGLNVIWILETHAHADHMTAARYLKKKLGAPIGIGSNIVQVQETFARIFNLGSDFTEDGSQFDRLWSDNESFSLGELRADVLYTPGHTPACVSYLIGDACFVGDTLFMPDFGTARTDFPQGDAATLYRSIRKILSLPEDTRIFVGHDYKAPGRSEYAWETTVAEEAANNIHVGNGCTEETFVAMRTERDATLGMPALLLPAIQVNIRAGDFPPAEGNGTRYLKLPLNTL